MRILVTGAAGFIGFHLVNQLIKEGFEVVGLDNINDYYDPKLKYARLKEAGIEIDDIYYGKYAESKKFEKYHFIKLDIEDAINLNKVFSDNNFDYVCHLAAQAGVRYSIENPRLYIQSNIVGFFNILECCRNFPIKHLIYASSSSVYGNNSTVPFSETDNVDHPVSLYAATKKSNELMAHTYSHLYQIPTTGLRFFTVYGPWGRPDMAYFSFTKSIIEDKPIKVFNNGQMSRDFTFIDDIIEGIGRLLNKPPNDDTAYQLFNIGNDHPVTLLHFITILEQILNKETIKEFLPMQAGDVVKTWANIDQLNTLTGYRPMTKIQDGLKNFVNWYKKYYKL
ncbi:MAG: NAD-dependent epimerase [Saprospiraceae bacterium]